MNIRSPEASETASAWEPCIVCAGSGMALNPNTGDPDTCWECKGDGVVRARDMQGRFVGNPKEPHQ